MVTARVNDRHRNLHSLDSAGTAAQHNQDSALYSDPLAPKKQPIVFCCRSVSPRPGNPYRVFIRVSKDFYSLRHFELPVGLAIEAVEAKGNDRTAFRTLIIDRFIYDLTDTTRFFRR